MCTCILLCHEIHVTIMYIMHIMEHTRMCGNGPYIVFLWYSWTDDLFCMWYVKWRTIKGCRVYSHSVAPDQHAHLRNLIWELNCPLISPWEPIVQNSGPCTNLNQNDRMCSSYTVHILYKDYFRTMRLILYTVFNCVAVPLYTYCVCIYYIYIYPDFRLFLIPFWFKDFLFVNENAYNKHVELHTCFFLSVLPITFKNLNVAWGEKSDPVGLFLILRK